MSLHIGCGLANWSPRHSGDCSHARQPLAAGVLAERLAARERDAIVAASAASTPSAIAALRRRAHQADLARSASQASSAFTVSP